MCNAQDLVPLHFKLYSFKTCAIHGDLFLLYVSGEHTHDP